MSRILSHYDSAVFIARMKHTDSKLEERIKRLLEPKVEAKYKLGCEEKRIVRWEKEQEASQFIIAYLKEHYPDSDYAEKFMKNDEWQEKLRFPTEESVICDCHPEGDTRHCGDDIHTNGCYTCCFVCFSPKLCQWSKCKLLTK